MSRRPTRPGHNSGVATNSPVANLDSLALVKLIAIEAETAAPRQELRRGPDRAPRLLAAVEVT